jgi:hypothetical protein
VKIAPHHCAGGLGGFDGGFLCFNQIHGGVDASGKTRGRDYLEDVIETNAAISNPMWPELLPRLRH